MSKFMSDSDVVDRVLEHIANRTTDRSDTVWQEPVDHYRSDKRFARELDVLRSVPTPFCPSVALSKPGDYIAREAAGVPLIVVRGQDGIARAFKNACRHRGAELVSRKGCSGAFVCPYHGWSYALNGDLIGIPHADGFPDLDKTAHGLAEVTVFETHGIIFVQQDASGKDRKQAAKMLDDVPDILKPDQIIFSESEFIVEANWKLHLESFLEGYHIKAAHSKTFFPFGYDNLTVVEYSGANSRVTFPFRRIEDLADVAPKDRHVSDKLTYLNHLFPNVVLAELSHHRTLAVLEPMSPSQTKIHAYNMTKSTDNPDSEAVIETAKRDLDFVNGTGQQEDIALVSGIQRTLHSEANDVFTFGHFEGAITHFHRQMAKRVNEAP